jgi:predicted nuclease of restriction endonuclease-like RecB superfamily
MLTADLLRTTIRKGEIRPTWIDTTRPQWLTRAEELCAIYERGLHERRCDIEEQMDDLLADDRSHMVSKGFAKLLDDRAVWETASPLEPSELRRMVFERAAACHPVSATPDNTRTWRGTVLQEVARETGMTVEAIEQAFYADLKDEQRMVSYKPMAPRDLLDRYNLALAQGVLLRAREMRLHVAVSRPQKLRQLFRWLKFHQLMHRAKRVSASRWDIVIDGPMSLFSQGQRYGVLMAQFLPAILLLDQWAIEADIQWPNHDQTLQFRLTPDDGLRTHLTEKGVWVSQEDKVLYERINAGSDWTASRDAEIMDLGGQDVVVPDLVLTRNRDQKKAFVEIVGFWRASWLERRAAVLRQHAPDNLIVCISRRLAAGDKGEGFAEDWIDYAEVIPLARILAQAEKIAR